MATQETQVLDEIVVSTRRKLLTLGGAALAGLAFGTPKAQAATTAYTDAQILNFALNLEYLEANFYTLAAVGKTIDQVGINIGAGGATGTPSIVTKAGGPTACQVPWSASAATPVAPLTVGNVAVIQAYANETAAEERTHVSLIQGALGTAAVAQPALDLYNSFLALGTLIGVPNFDPFSSPINFLLGAYIFEDVGVTAYAGAASSLTVTSDLVTAAGILAVEAYHGGLIRTTISALDPSNTFGLRTATRNISNVRATADGTGTVTPDDYGVVQVATPLNGAVAGAQGILIANVNQSTSLIYTRTPQQVLSIVTGGTQSPYKGLFFPSGLNGTIV